MFPAAGTGAAGSDGNSLTARPRTSGSEQPSSGGTAFRIIVRAATTRIFISFGGSEERWGQPTRPGSCRAVTGNFYGTTVGGRERTRSAPGTVYQIRSKRQLHESLFLYRSTQRRGHIHKPHWCRAATAISTARPCTGGRKLRGPPGPRVSDSPSLSTLRPTRFSAVPNCGQRCFFA